MEKILTVVVPTYNMEKYLDRCLTSLIVDDEKMDLLEVLVVNDGSKDRSSEIAHSYEARYPNTFRVIDKENGNYGSCINAALFVAGGRYIKVLDADDYFYSSSLSSLLDNLCVVDNIDMIMTDIDYIDGQGSICSTLSFELPSFATIGIADIDNNAIGQLHMHAIAYRTILLLSSNYKQTEGISYTDLEWTYYPMANVASIQYFKFPLYVYNTSREGQTTSWKKHCGDLWMEMGIIRQMVERYNEFGGYAGQIQSTYMQEKLRCYIGQIYKYFLLSYPHYLKQSELKLFDQNVYLCQDLYSELDNTFVSVHRLGTFYYIREWRKRFSRITAFFILYDLQELISRIYHKLK